MRRLSTRSLASDNEEVIYKVPASGNEEVIYKVTCE